MCEMKILRSEVLWCIFGTLVQGWRHTCVVSSVPGCSGKVQNRDVWDVVCLGTLVQDGLAHMRGVTWKAVPAKFKTDVWDENLTARGFVIYLWEVGSGWVCTNAWCNMESCSGKVQKRDVWDESLRPKDVKFSGVSLGFWFRMGWHKCVV